jgi:6-pyruvoyltetrahydropterin/6-carboxytetrahydropterin synthase
MFTVGVKRSFVARHFLIGGDWGSENELHGHDYTAEVELEGLALDQHGYLLDIVEVEAALDAVLARYRDSVLNDQPELAGLNPSLERFAELLANQLADRLRGVGFSALTVKLWESDTAWASFRRGH